MKRKEVIKEVKKIVKEELILKEAAPRMKINPEIKTINTMIIELNRVLAKSGIEPDSLEGRNVVNKIKKAVTALQNVQSQIKKSSSWLRN